MNKEQQELVDEVYKNYLIEDAKILPNMSKEKMTEFGYGLSQEEFINKCKTDTEFSEKWGLKIEERTTLEQVGQTNPVLKGSTTLYPRKLITITYNDKTIEQYERRG
jgi:hypothetical protein